MEKLILLFSVLFTASLPIVLCTRKKPLGTLRMIQVSTVIVAFLWAIACRVWYPQLVFPE